MIVYNLIVLHVNNEDEAEIYCTTYGTLESALMAQTIELNRILEERRDEDLQVNEYLDVMEKSIVDENGGYVTLTVQIAHVK